MNEDKIIEAVIKVQERLDHIEETMVTKSDIHQITDTLDKQTVILLRIDQERVFTNERIKRIENDVEVIKEKVGIV